MQVLEDRRFKFGFTALAVDVLDAEQHRAARGFRSLGREQRRVGVAEMEVAVGAWRETENR